jgi:UDP-glucose 4-epimerase
MLALQADLVGHEVFAIVAPEHVGDCGAGELAKLYYPRVALRRRLGDKEGFFDCGKAANMLGWFHEDW